MPREKQSKDSTNHTPTDGKSPICIRCGVVVQFSKELYTICDACLEEDFRQLCIEARDRGITAPLTRKEKRDGQGDRPAGGLQAPSAGTLTPIRKVLSDEPPF